MAKTGHNKTDFNLLFRAFSDRTRLRILHMMRSGEICVCDIVNVLNVPQPKVSRHLAYLRKANLVSARKEGLWMYYKLVPGMSGLHKRLIQCLEDCFQDIPELQADQKKLQRSKSAGCCK